GGGGACGDLGRENLGVVDVSAYLLRLLWADSPPSPMKLSQAPSARKTMPSPMIQPFVAVLTIEAPNDSPALGKTTRITPPMTQSQPRSVITTRQSATHSLCVFTIASPATSVITPAM